MGGNEVVAFYVSPRYLILKEVTNATKCSIFSANPQHICFERKSRGTATPAKLHNTLICDSNKDMKLNHFKDDSESTQADRQNSSDV